MPCARRRPCALCPQPPLDCSAVVIQCKGAVNWDVWPYFYAQAVSPSDRYIEATTACLSVEGNASLTRDMCMHHLTTHETGLVPGACPALFTILLSLPGSVASQAVIMCMHMLGVCCCRQDQERPYQHGVPAPLLCQVHRAVPARQGAWQVSSMHRVVWFSAVVCTAEHLQFKSLGSSPGPLTQTTRMLGVS